MDLFNVKNVIFLLFHNNVWLNLETKSSIIDSKKYILQDISVYCWQKYDFYYY